MFFDRHDAAVQLAAKLSHHLDDDCVVLAIPRGGVPIATYVAATLNCELDLLLSKKIGHPYNREFAIGSVTLHGSNVDKDAGNVHTDYIREEIHRITKLLKTSYKFFMGERKPLPLKDKVVIVIDDGIATGNTMLADVSRIKKEKPARIVIAVPVCSREAPPAIAAIADEFICLLVPDQFGGV